MDIVAPNPSKVGQRGWSPQPSPETLPEPGTPCYIALWTRIGLMFTYMQTLVVNNCSHLERHFSLKSLCHVEEGYMTRKPTLLAFQRHLKLVCGGKIGSTMNF